MAMSLHAVPVAILAGITGYAAVLFIGLYVTLANVVEPRARREYLTFGLTCLAVVVYDLTSVNLYNAGSFEQGFFWQRGQLASAGILGVFYIVFVWDFLKMPIPATLRLACVVMAVLGLSVGVWESPATLTREHALIKEVHILQHRIVYYEGALGAITELLMILFFIIFAVNILFLLRYFRSPKGCQVRGRQVFLLATVISGITATNDLSVALGIHNSMYMFEYGIAALFLSMGGVLLLRFGDLHTAINALNRDLSKSNAELMIALEKARRSDQAKTEFLASISHELRTPLNAIINLPEGLLANFTSINLIRCDSCGAEFKLEDDELFDPGSSCEVCGAIGLKRHQRLVFRARPDKAQSCLQTVVSAGRHLLGLVNGVLYASKLELGRADLETTTFDPLDLVKEVVESTRPIAEKKNISLSLKECASLGTVVADRVKIGQVLYNIIDNAIKFSPRDGLVEVNLAATQPNEIIISIRDQGIGISQEHQAMIFEKFHQVDRGSTRAYSGTGLGLAISKGLVELHGGRIWVESAIDCGAAFFVGLPRVPRESNKNAGSLKASALLSDKRTAGIT
ncbi:MAG: hypothetical protein JXA30_05135 [Deltaproteobacteria bacterium]|nr:hypothetical protein [Deltaproteobacteria bacterium]